MGLRSRQKDAIAQTLAISPDSSARQSIEKGIMHSRPALGRLACDQEASKDDVLAECRHTPCAWVLCNIECGRYDNRLCIAGKVVWSWLRWEYNIGAEIICFQVKPNLGCKHE